jgi:hypothetical protein
VEGGYGGLTRTLTILADGEADVVTSRGIAHGHVDSVELAQLMETLEKSGLFESDGSYEGQGADLQRYEVTLFDATVSTTDGAIPPALVGPIDKMQAIATAILSSQ